MVKTLDTPECQIFDDFLDAATFERVRGFVLERCPMGGITNQNWTGRDYWHPNDGNVLKSEVWTSKRSNMPAEILVIPQAVVSHQLFPYNADEHAVNLSAFAYPTGSGFGWHDDGNALIAFVLYVSQWQKDWGGELLLESANGIGHHVQPRENRLALITRGVSHKIAQVDFRAGKNIRFAVAGFITKR